MRGETTTISLRLPKASLKALDKATKTTGLSRSFLMRAGLDRYLADISQYGAAPRRVPENVNAYIWWMGDGD